MVLAVFSIKYLVNQIIVGVVLNVLVSGLTGFLFSTVDAGRTKTCSTRPGRLPIIADPRAVEHSAASGPSCSSSPSWAT